MKTKSSLLKYLNENGYLKVNYNKHERCYLTKLENNKTENAIQIFCEKNKNYLKNISLKVTKLYNIENPINSVNINFKFGDEMIEGLTVHEFHVFYRQIEKYIEKMVVQSSSKLKFSSKIEIFGFNKQFIDTIRAVKYGENISLYVNSIIHKLEIKNHNMKIFKYFIDDAMFKNCSENEKENFLQALSPIIWMRSGYFKDFIYKHLQHVAKNLQNTEIQIIKEKECELIARIKIANDKYLELNMLDFTIFINEVGHYISRLAFRLSNFDNSFENFNDQIIQFVMILIEKQCPNLKELGIYSQNNLVLPLNGVQIELVQKFPFLSHIHFLNDMSPQFHSMKELESMLENKIFELNRLQLTSNWMKKELTISHFEKIFKHPIKELFFYATYDQIPSWKFVQNIQCDKNIRNQLERIIILGQNTRIKDLCIGVLLLELFRLLSLDTICIIEYEFNVFHIPKEMVNKTRRLILKNCKFEEMAKTKNILKIFQNIENIKLINTEISYDMIKSFKNISEITIENCSYMNNDRLIQIYDICKYIKVSNF